MINPENDILLWGLSFIESVQQMRNPEWDQWVGYLTFLGSHYFYMVALSFVLFFKGWRQAWQLAAVLLFGLTLNETLKEIISQPRPFEFWPQLGLISEVGYGLPSGHSSGAMIFFGSMALLFDKTWLKVTCVSLAVGVGLSRIYLGVHFPSDVLAGWALGMSVLTWYGAWRRDLNYKPFAIASLVVVALALAVMTNNGFQKQLLMGSFALLGLVFTLNFDKDWPIPLSLSQKVLGVGISLALTVAIVVGGKSISSELWMVPIRYGILVFVTLGLYPMVYSRLLRAKV